DTRVARRWNIDPVVTPSLSSYHAFELNPIWKVDPKGNKADDYRLNKDGSMDLLKKTDDDFDRIFSSSTDDLGVGVLSESITVSEDFMKGMVGSYPNGTNKQSHAYFLGGIAGET